jgi:hypothetical protein
LNEIKNKLVESFNNIDIDGENIDMSIYIHDDSYKYMYYIIYIVIIILLRGAWRSLSSSGLPQPSLGCDHSIAHDGGGFGG